MTAPVETVAPQDQASESNRDRVRRLLFQPLGFRFARGVDPAAGRLALDQIADELAYLGDDDLAVLGRMLRVHGQGSARDLWPERATFVGTAHLVRPLPLEADPKLVSWFASVEGPRMQAEGTLVETWRYFERKRVPPYTPEARRLVHDRAAECWRRVRVVEDKLSAGWDPGADDAAFARSYRAEDARLRALLDQVRRSRGAAAEHGQQRGVRQ